MATGKPQTKNDDERKKYEIYIKGVLHPLLFSNVFRSKHKLETPLTLQICKKEAVKV